MTSTDQTVRRPGPTTSTQGSRRLPAVPGALAALLVTVGIIGLVWALLVPPFQAPDETAHFAYAQSLATRLSLPGDPKRPFRSSDQSIADRASNASLLSYWTDAVRPPWNASSFDAYLREARHRPSQSNGGGPNPEGVNPPLFYVYSDLAYWASSSSSLFARLYAMQVWGVVLLLANVIGAWLLAGQVFGRRRLVQLVCAAVCGLMPMETFISTSISPDAMMVPLWTFALWLGARLITRGWGTGTAVSLCAVTAAAILTKATSYALIPGVLMALALAWRGAPGPRRHVLGHLAAAVATLAIPVLAWVAFAKSQGRSPINTVQSPAGAGPRAGFHIGSFISYVWEFYLPRLPFMKQVDPQPRAAYYVWIKQGWGTFGWLDVGLARWTYPVFTVISGTIGLAAAGILVRVRHGRRLHLLGYFTLTLLALLFGLHLTEYRALIAGQGLLLQGRYLLPVISLFALAVALVVRHLPRKWSVTSAGLVVAALLLLQVLSLATVAKAYYT